MYTYKVGTVILKDQKNVLSKRFRMKVNTEKYSTLSYITNNQWIFMKQKWILMKQSKNSSANRILPNIKIVNRKILSIFDNQLMTIN